MLSTYVESEPSKKLQNLSGFFRLADFSFSLLPETLFFISRPDLIRLTQVPLKSIVRVIVGKVPSIWQRPQKRDIRPFPRRSCRVSRSDCGRKQRWGSQTLWGSFEKLGIPGVVLSFTPEKENSSKNISHLSNTGWQQPSFCFWIFASPEAHGFSYGAREFGVDFGPKIYTNKSHRYLHNKHRQLDI